MPHAGLSTGIPAAIEAWRAGFCPSPAVRIWPRITSLTRSPEIPARSIAALMADLPNSCAGRLAKAPLKAPTGVRVALTMTISSFIGNSCCGRGAGFFGTAASLKDAAGLSTRRHLRNTPEELGLFGPSRKQGEVAGSPYRAATKYWLRADE